MATSFPLFPNLPNELRLTIWKLALEPRIVELCFDALKEVNGNNNEDWEEDSNIEQDGFSDAQEQNEDEDKDQPKKRSDLTNDSHAVENATIGLSGADEPKDEDQQTRAASPDITAVENGTNDDADSTSETSDHLFVRPLGPGQFYSPSPLPSLLRVNSEARSVAVAAAMKGFPVPNKQEDVYYNPEIDVLYFPAGCWPQDIMGFEQVVSDEVKGSIRRIALENLLWMSYWEDGTINGQITIEKFKNVKEFIFAVRELTQCGCCIDFDGPERGLVEFVEIDAEAEVQRADAVATKQSDPDSDSEEEMNRVNDELRMKREEAALGLGVGEDDEAPKREIKRERRAGRFAYTKRYVDRLKREFLKIKESNPDWNVPEARMVRLKRDGEFAGDP